MKSIETASIEAAVEGKKIWTAPQMQVAALPVVTLTGGNVGSADVFTQAS